MNGNSFGHIFRITTWGESHGASLGAIVDGCPSGIALSSDDFAEDLQRRQGGSASFTTPRKESDLVFIESGVYEGLTTGTPICLRILNQEQKSVDYDKLKDVFRPGHADLSTHLKHGHRDHRGGGRSSARETTARVAAGVVAKKILSLNNIYLSAWVSQVGPHKIEDLSLQPLDRIRAHPTWKKWENDLNSLREKKDSWGGVVSCKIEGVPAGLGEPIFDKLGGILSHALMSLPAAVSFRQGSILEEMPGSAIRDPIAFIEGSPLPTSNQHGGILGGMSTGLPLICHTGFHAPTSIPQPIETVSKNGEPVSLEVEGRHDAFPLPRALPMVEAMVALSLVDLLMRAGMVPQKFSKS